MAGLRFFYPQIMQILNPIRVNLVDKKCEEMNQEVDVDVIPCSFAQQRLWFLDQFKPGDPAYNIPVALHLTGAVDALVLEHCLNEIVRRHESLRTTFTSEDGRPSQVIYPELTLKLFAADLRD